MEITSTSVENVRLIWHLWINWSQKRSEVSMEPHICSIQCTFSFYKAPTLTKVLQKINLWRQDNILLLTFTVRSVEIPNLSDGDTYFLFNFSYGLRKWSKSTNKESIFWKKHASNWWMWIEKSGFNAYF